MPVSKKRKKDGKPVQRHGPAQAPEEHASHPEGAAAPQPRQHGKPRNPFVAQPAQHRGSQRGR